MFILHISRGDFSISPLTRALGGVPAERFHAGPGPCVLYLHGGGYVIGSPHSHRHLTSRLAQLLEGEVFSLDYRLAPEAPYPAAVEDALAAWTALSAMGGRPVAVAGDSAGGGLACALTMALAARGETPPACLALFSPWVSLKTSADSYDRLAALDPMISRATAGFFARLYAPGERHGEPLASPLYGDVTGFPPTLIQAGGREVFLDDIQAFAARLQQNGVVELSVQPEMFHVWHLYWPRLAEARAALADAARFIERHHRTSP
ncbi:alpha/beta hydrolase [Camelimonas fluminis]|uniref:Alpha/beta hydrolase n=1 Tax=Camelimonas fluminis TaxID=1576911 RepID=A0ABV7UHE0_9HYPH|nr:alpha/beta hydrolase [Camelimonas fluminis]